ncbi:MAG: class I SAM-dependent methyltransferase [Chlamydiae bacterium]|nr:class I SAM-dependent methyltransferase [Chlamydiota bacterium]
MNKIYPFRQLTNHQISNHFIAENLKACTSNGKISWMNRYLQKGGTIPSNSEVDTSFKIASILRENRSEAMRIYSIQPSRIDYVAERAIHLAETVKKVDRLAIDLGGGNSSLALYLLKRNWKVIVVDPSDEALNLLQLRVRNGGLTALAKSKLFLVPTKMEDFSFPSNVTLINAQSSLPYCDAGKVINLWKNIYDSLEPGGVFAGDFFNNCSDIRCESVSDFSYASTLDDNSPSSRKEIISRLQLGTWMASPSLTHSMLKNSSYNICYFTVDDTSIEFIGYK